MNEAFPAARYGGVRREGRDDRVETSRRLAQPKSNLAPCQHIAWQIGNTVAHPNIGSYIVFEVTALASSNLLSNLRTQDAKLWSD